MSNMSSMSSEWTVVSTKKTKNKMKASLMKTPLMKLTNDVFKMRIRVLSVEKREIVEDREDRVEIRPKKVKRGGVRIRMSRLLRSSGYTFITRKMIDRLIESEKNQKMKGDEKEDNSVDEVADEVNDEVDEEIDQSEPADPPYELIGHYFDPQNLSVVSPDGVKCEDVIEKAARISEWWTRVLGYKVF